MIPKGSVGLLRACAGENADDAAQLSNEHIILIRVMIRKSQYVAVVALDFVISFCFAFSVVSSFVAGCDVSKVVQQICLHPPICKLTCAYNTRVKWEDEIHK